MSEKKQMTINPVGNLSVWAGGLDHSMMVGAVATQAWMDIGADAVRFVGDRLQQDSKARKAMLECTTLEDMQQVQSEFFATAQSQYIAEASKILDRLSKAAAVGFTTPSKSHRYDDIPL